MSAHEFYMKRCIDLAKNGLGMVAPNPMVGSVIVHEGNIIGEGFHQIFGHAHAEVNAINSVKDKALLKNATLYVSLEPCSHFGKTPPCANLIIENEIPEVIIGCVDTFSEVSGKGIEKLKNSGINVSTGVLEKKCRDLNKRFFTFHEKKRPYVILKWAQTLDGFIDKKRDNSLPQINWISDDIAKIMVHKWRSQEQAIMVGTNTALNDNPQLNVREVSGKNPIRVVLDKELRLPASLHIFDNKINTVVFTGKYKENVPNLEYIQISPDADLIPETLETLYKKSIQSVIIEGGKQLLETFIKINLWDEARVLIGNKTFGEGLPAPMLNNRAHSAETLGSNIILYYSNSPY